MSCFPCFQSSDEATSTATDGQPPVAQPMNFTPPPPQPAPTAHDHNHNHNHDHEDKDPFENPNNAPETDNHTVKSYTFRELATATKHFRQECLLGEGGFGKVFKGTLPASSGGQIIVVRQLHRNGAQPSHEFVNEVSDLSFLRHPNLVKINGYCADGEQRILVYEYMPAGSLKNRLFELPEGKQPLDWSTRMKIALGIAEGLEFLHEKADTPVVYRDLKSSNILLDEDNKPKLADYGLAKLVQSSNNKMMGGNGYIAPELERQGEVTLKSDVYSFGVVLLELITGRRALDTSLPNNEQNLVAWAQPIFKDPTRFPDMADPLLQKAFPVMSLNQAVGVAAMCLQEEPIARPLISDISGALSFLAMAPPAAAPAVSKHSDSFAAVSKHSDSESESEDDRKMDSESDSESESEDEEDSKITSHENKQEKKPSSDFEYGESSSDSSDDEPGAKSSKLASGSKRMSKKKSVAKKASSKRVSMKKAVSKKGSESNRSSWSSLSSDEYSIGFSLRLDDSDFPDFQDRSESTVSRHDDKHGHYNNDSSDSDDSEEES